MQPTSRESGAKANGGAETNAQHDTGVARNVQEPRSNYGTVPGSEFPPAVYLSVFGAYAWILLTSWLAFASDADADLALSFVVVLAVVFFALPVLIYLTAKHRARTARAAQADFLSGHVETATGNLTSASALLQVLLVPWALALAATLIGATNLLVH